MFVLVKGTVYPFDTLFIVDENDEEVEKYIKRCAIKKKKRLLKYLKFDNKTLGQCTLHKCNVIIRVKDAPENAASKGVLSHEIMHGVFAIASLIGLKYGRKSEEAFTYLGDYLTTKFYEKYERELEKKNKDE